MHVDARRYAVAIIEQLQPARSNSPFHCYGTEDSVLIGIGRVSSLDLSATDTLDAVWDDINDYIETNSDNYIFGFIGFDPANQLNKKIKSYRQKIDLFVPETVIECNRSGCNVFKGDADIGAIKPMLNGIESNLIDIDDLDLSELTQQYEESAAHFISAIDNGTLERATLARKINSQRDFDLLSTFISNYSKHELARSFYFSNEHIAFAGQCPEVLAEGNTHTFATHKLSGTYAKNNSLSLAELTSRFQTDERIISEHQSAIAAIEISLAEIGTVHSKKFEVMELPTLLHGWSKFETRPNENVTVTKCLRSVFPFGINPVDKGFELLARHEKFHRGPYYGLTGCIRPGGEFSFTQVLRSAFVDNDGSYLLVGAAITSHSTAQLEMTETCNKLASIQVYERRDA